MIIWTCFCISVGWANYCAYQGVGTEWTAHDTLLEAQYLGLEAR